MSSETPANRDNASSEQGEAKPRRALEVPEDADEPDVSSPSTPVRLRPGRARGDDTDQTGRWSWDLPPSAPGAEPEQPQPTQPARTQPRPTEPAPTESAPTESAPTESAPTESAPTESAPAEPARSERTAEPAPTEHQPADPDAEQALSEAPRRPSSDAGYPRRNPAPTAKSTTEDRATPAPAAAPAEETPAEKTSAEQARSTATPVDPTTSDEPAAEPAAATEAPATDAPAKKTAAKKAPAKKAAAKKAAGKPGQGKAGQGKGGQGKGGQGKGGQGKGGQGKAGPGKGKGKGKAKGGKGQGAKKLPGRKRMRVLQGMGRMEPRPEIPDQSHLPPEQRTDLAVRVSNLHVTYRTSFEKRPTLKQALMRFGRGQRAVREVEALKDVSFEVKTGSAMGIIGANGAGKSTLMRSMAGILPPTDGTVEVWGRASTLLALGVGFNNGLSGRENIILGGLAAGLSREEVEERANEIAEWTELGDFIDMPMRTYSSGMFSRVSFSVAVHMEPDILMIDEALSTGDAHFKEKAAAKMSELRSQARAMFLVSHGLSSIKEMCDEAIWIDKGKLMERGEPADVISSYTKFLKVRRSSTTYEDL